MAKRTKKGLPKDLAEALEIREVKAQEPTLQEFINEMHGEHSASIPQDGLPSVEWLQDQFKTKSAIIRYLTNQRHSVKVIAKHLGMRYQHVRNVANSPLKRGPNEDWRKPLLEGTNIPDAKDFKSKPE